MKGVAPCMFLRKTECVPKAAYLASLPEIRRQSRQAIHPAHEDEVGQLQSRSPSHTIEYRIGKKAAGMPGIHRDSRDGPPARTEPRQGLH